MKFFLWVVLFGLVTAGGVRADEAAARAILDKLIAAQAADNYEGFVAMGTTELQAAFSKTQFEASTKVLVPILARAHEITFLGELNQRGFEVYLYRFRFSTGGDDIMGTLSVKDGKVGGILFR